MKPSYLISNKILSRLYKGSARRLEQASRNLCHTQERYLMNLLRTNADCMYGKKYGFTSVNSVDEYQERVPLSSYEDYLPFIDKIRSGEPDILSSQAVSRFSLTSGTASEYKLIPSSTRLLDEFSNALGAWIYYNYGNYKSLVDGTSFWIITPAGDLPEIKSSIPVGFDEDSNYFGHLARMVLKPIMVLPDTVSRISDIENYYYVSAYFLLSSSALRLISVWNPSLIILFCDKIKHYFRELISDISKGSVNPPSELSEDESRQLKPFLKARPKRAARLSEIVSNYQTDDPHIWNEIWPGLSLISCWTDGWAGDFLPQIRQLFPGVTVQGKGLLATEAVVSIPFASGDPVLAATSHFYEFIDLVNREVLLSHQLKNGEYYEVVVTTGGGLYRYQLNDIIQVSGFYGELPQFRFVGKTDLFSDICGEKLHEYHVSKALKAVFQKYKIPGSDHFLVPEIGDASGRYALYIAEVDINELSVDGGLLVNELDHELRKNYHYDYCRKLEQLCKPEIVLMSDQMVREYLSRKLGRAKPGTVKFPKLEKRECLGETFFQHTTV